MPMCPARKPSGSTSRTSRCWPWMWFDMRARPLPSSPPKIPSWRAPTAPPVHPQGNVVRTLTIVHGDPTAPADVWVEGMYETGMQDQAPLGPEAGLAVPAADGGVDLFIATQWLHADLEQLAPCLDLPLEKVHLHLSGVGGAFGAREDVSMQIHACMLALHTRRPVKMSYGRQESFYGHVHRHPARIWMRHGASRDGKLVNIQAR